MARPLLFILFTLTLSCSIIEDGDITSRKEFDNLTIKSIDIKLETSTGIKTITARVTKDSVVNIPVPGGTLTRTVWMDWPALGNSKLKLRSGFTGSFKSYTSFLESGEPFTFYLFDSDTTLFEVYRFRYRNDGRLNNIIYEETNFTRISNDSLVWEDGNNNSSVKSIIRRSPDPSKSGTISFGGGAFTPHEFNLESFNFRGRTYTRPGVSDGSYSYYSYGATFPPNDGLVEVKSLEKQYVSLIDRNNVSGDCQCSQWADTFYFHPLMIFKDRLLFEDYWQTGHPGKLGDGLFLLYMVDWWRPVSSQETKNDETVTFSFRYDR